MTVLPAEDKTASIRKRGRWSDAFGGYEHSPRPTSLWRALAQDFDAMLQKRPMIINGVSVLLLSSLSDSIAQMLEGSSPGEFDMPRMVRFAAFRASVGMPILSLWLRFLDWFVERFGLQEGSRKAVAVKIFLDCMASAPAHSIASAPAHSLPALQCRPGLSMPGWSKATLYSLEHHHGA